MYSESKIATASRSRPLGHTAATLQQQVDKEKAARSQQREIITAVYLLIITEHVPPTAEETEQFDGSNGSGVPATACHL